MEHVTQLLIPNLSCMEQSCTPAQRLPIHGLNCSLRHGLTWKDELVPLYSSLGKDKSQQWLLKQREGWERGVKLISSMKQQGEQSMQKTEQKERKWLRVKQSRAWQQANVGTFRWKSMSGCHHYLGTKDMWYSLVFILTLCLESICASGTLWYSY